MFIYEAVVELVAGRKTKGPDKGSRSRPRGEVKRCKMPIRRGGETADCQSRLDGGCRLQERSILEMVWSNFIHTIAVVAVAQERTAQQNSRHA